MLKIKLTNLYNQVSLHTDMKVLSLTATLLAALSLTAAAKSYTVKSGDTISSISRKHKVSPTSLMKLNKISDPTKLRIGQSLRVTSSSSKRSFSTSSRSVKTSNYRVNKGDTFYSIARRNNLSVNELRALNPNVSTSRISLGQTIKVSGALAQPPKSRSIAKTAKKPISSSRNTRSSKNAVQTSNSKNFPTAITLATKPAAPAPNLETAAAVQIALKHETLSMPSAMPPIPPVIQEVPVIEKPAPSPAEPAYDDILPVVTSSVASIILTHEITFDAFATKHGTDTVQLNALNGWNLPKTTVLARGSEIYVPK